MRIRWIVFAALLVSTPVRAQNESRGNPQVRFENESVDQMIATFMADQNVSGLSLAIVQAPYVTRATGYGVADVPRRTLVSANTMFDIADMRNAFTAVAVMQLVEEGKLDLEAMLPLIRMPSEYPVLEEAVESASGQTYQQFVRRGQFERLGLEHTFFGSELPLAPREILKPGDRHHRFLQEPVLIDPPEPASPDGGGRRVGVHPRAIYSSASDVSVWDIGLAGEILIRDPALRKLLYEPATSSQGVRTSTSGPWFFPGRPGLMIATGSGDGFSSLLSRFTHRDELLCVTLLANREGLDLSQLARRIAGAFNPKLGPPPSAAGLRVQQSPGSVQETIARAERAFRGRSVTVTAVDRDRGRIATSLGPVSVWEEQGQVWIGAADPLQAKSNEPLSSRLAARAQLDRALLQAVAPHADAGPPPD